MQARYGYQSGAAEGCRQLRLALSCGSDSRRLAEETRIPIPNSERFGAFISYRHIDPDRKVAAWLQAALETYRVPPALAAAGTKPRLGRVFRDEEELAASGDLSQSIQDALQRADALVVVCSARTPGSQWVNAEVQRFAELGRADRVFALLVEGEPADAFPPALLALGHEPLAADLRPVPGESARAARRTALLKLLAGLLGLEFDALRRRDDERRRRRLALFAAAGGVLAVIFATLAVVAALQWQRAERELTVSRAQTLAAKAQIALADAQRGDGLAPGAQCVTCPDAQRAALLALESLRIHPTINADAVLRRALWRWARERLTAAPAEGEVLAAVGADGRLQVRAATEAGGAAGGSPASKSENPGDPEQLARSADGRLVLRRSAEGMDGWIRETAVLENAGSAGRIALLPHEWPIRLAVFSADGRWLTTVTGLVSTDAEDPSATALVGSTVRVWDTTTGEERTRVSLAAEDGIVDAMADAGGEWLATVGSGSADAGARPVRLWPLPPETLARVACSLLKRNLSPSEWATFVDAGPARETCPGLPAVSE